MSHATLSLGGASRTAGEKKLLLDCGRGATQRIEQIKIPFTEIDALFLTHLHSNHVVGIPDLRMKTRIVATALVLATLLVLASITGVFTCWGSG